MTIEMFLLIAFIAFLCEWIDSAVGMGYGTILSPLLILMDLPPLVVVPSILITQALGGLSASVYHHKQGNADFGVISTNPKYIWQKIKQHGLITAFKKGLSRDLKVVSIISSLGVLATIAAVNVANFISKAALTKYIGILVVIMGLLILLNYRFQYSTKKMFLLGIVSAFNKGLSGGGFGPLVTGGQIVLGQEYKTSIGCTTASEPIICITGFISYLLLKGLADWSLVWALGIGVILAGPVGALTTKKLNKQYIRFIIGALMLVLGILTLLKIYGLISIGISM